MPGFYQNHIRRRHGAGSGIGRAIRLALPRGRRACRARHQRGSGGRNGEGYQ